MSHLGSYKWFMRTQYIPELGVDYNVWGIITQEMMGFDYCLTTLGEKMNEIIGSR